MQIHDTDPAYIDDFSRTLMEGHYVKEGETIPQAYARAANAFCYGDHELAQRIYQYAYDGWFMFASPVLSNAPKGKWIEDPEKNGAHYWYKHDFVPEGKIDGMPISCFAMSIPDTANGQVASVQELASLSMAGGGLGAHNMIRGTSKKAPGPIPFMKMMDSAIGYFKQKGSRRGALAYYLDVDHPDILEHIQFRVPGGDAKRRSDNRTQFHCAVNLTDDFISRVKANQEYDLKCPHTGKVYDTLRARDVWEKIIEARALTGEPYLMKIDLANRRMPESQKRMGLVINGSNLCVAPETLVLTDAGHRVISSMEGESVNVWNGAEFSQVEIRKTGEGQRLVSVTTDSGQAIDCTPYHKFYVAEGYTGRAREVRAIDLRPGDKLIKSEFPVIEGGEPLRMAYQNGFYSGDGCYVPGKGSRVYLYGEKRQLAEEFKPVSRGWGTQENQDREYGYIDGLKSKFFVPDCEFSVMSRLEWLAGLADSDGTVARCGDSQTIQIASTQPGFLESVQLMLQTVGVASKVTVAREQQACMLPANDGSGELKQYECQTVRRLLISGGGVVALVGMGFRPRRLRLSADLPNRSAERFVKVVSVGDHGRTDDTYCFTEPLRHRGVFNGILTGQCSEITLPTDEDRTVVCCLSSLNIEKFDEWKDSRIVEDMIRYLDNVLQFFIDCAPDSLGKAVYSAERERALGLGTLGYHAYLQKHMIPFESGGFGSAVQVTNQIYSLIASRADAASRELAQERGEAPDMIGTGRRNSRLMAIAPNANSADLLRTSPSAEPWYRNVFMKDSRAGSFMIRNRHLEALLEAKGENTPETWQKILSDNGSVQGLDCLTDHEKKVFRCATEIDQHWVIELADHRGKYVDQAQSLNVFFTAGMSREYVNSVHLKFLAAENVITMYYMRMEREVKVDTAKSIERQALTEWKGEDCVACQG